MDQISEPSSLVADYEQYLQQGLLDEFGNSPTGSYFLEKIYGSLISPSNPPLTQPLQQPPESDELKSLSFSLTKLDVGGCNKITPDGLKSLSSLVDLTDLSLGNCWK